MLKIRRPLQVIVPLELRNDFSDNSDNIDRSDNNDDGQNYNFNSNSLNPRDLLKKTDLSEKKKFKKVAAMNVDIVLQIIAGFELTTIYFVKEHSTI